MNVSKLLKATALSAALSAPLAASAVTFQGISFDPSSVNFNAATLFEGEAGGGPIVAPGQELVGVGQINQIFGNGGVEFWDSGDTGIELSIVLSGYIAETVVPSATVAGEFDIQFSGGSVQLWRDITPDFDVNNPATWGDGTLFLDLAGSPTGGVGPGGAITLTSTAGFGPTGVNIFGFGNLDVVGGDAAIFFDTNGFNCSPGAAAPCPDDADVSFTSSGQLGNNPQFPFFGTGDIFTAPQAVPEPMTTALMGLGLLGMGVVRRKRS